MNLLYYKQIIYVNIITLIQLTIQKSAIILALFHMIFLNMHKVYLTIHFRLSAIKRILCVFYTMCAQPKMLIYCNYTLEYGGPIYSAEPKPSIHIHIGVKNTVATPKPMPLPNALASLI